MSRPFVVLWREAIGDSGLPPRARLVAWALSKYMDTDGQNCFPSQETVAGQCGYRSTRAVKQGLGELQDGGWLEWVPGHGPGHSNRYRAAIPDDHHLSKRGPDGTHSAGAEEYPTVSKRGPDGQPKSTPRSAKGNRTVLRTSPYLAITKPIPRGEETGGEEGEAAEVMDAAEGDTATASSDATREHGEKRSPDAPGADAQAHGRLDAPAADLARVKQALAGGEWRGRSSLLRKTRFVAPRLDAVLRVLEGVEYRTIKYKGGGRPRKEVRLVP